MGSRRRFKARTSTQKVSRNAYRATGRILRAAKERGLLVDARQVYEEQLHKRLARW